MAYFSVREYYDMILTYGEAYQNSREAVRLYQERYPDRRTPHRGTITAAAQRLRDTGSLLPRGEGRERQRNFAADEEILDCIAEDPTRSIRSISREVGVTLWSVQRTLNEQLLHPFHVQQVQGLSPAD